MQSSALANQHKTKLDLPSIPLTKSWSKFTKQWWSSASRWTVGVMASVWTILRSLSSCLSTMKGTPCRIIPSSKPWRWLHSKSTGETRPCYFLRTTHLAVQPYSLPNLNYIFSLDIFHCHYGTSWKHFVRWASRIHIIIVITVYYYYYNYDARQRTLKPAERVTTECCAILWKLFEELFHLFVRAELFATNYKRTEFVHPNSPIRQCSNECFGQP